MGAIDINTLTIEQYLALTRRDRPGAVIPELGNDVDFEIKSQFTSELRCNLFAVMLRAFPITLIGTARRWRNLLPLQENIHATEEGCKIRKVGEEVHLTKEHPLKDNGK
ncbi:hypothetical protein Tco_1479456, partial [Tanacetum coccineum]